MQKTYRRLVLSLLSLFAPFGALVYAPIRVVQLIADVPCSLEKLYAELAYNKSEAKAAVGKPRRSAETRNHAGMFVAFMKAVNPISSVSVA